MAEISHWPPGSRGDLEKVLQGEYDIPGINPDSPIVLDIGANIGCFSAWAKERWPGAQVFAYEPNPEAFEYLEKNCPHAVCRKCAISNFDGKAPLYLGRNNLGEASLVNVGEQDMTRAGLVKVAHASKLPPADIIKIDTEGSELVIVSNYQHWQTVKAVMYEWHSHNDRNVLRHFFLSKGFALVEDKETHWSGRGIQKWVRQNHPHLFIGVLSSGGKTWIDNRNSIDGLLRMAAGFNVNVTVSWEGSTGVDRARNRLFAAARKRGDITHFMFLDDDIVFDPIWVINMVRSDLDVVGAAYPRKEIKWEMLEAAVKSGVPACELPKHSSDWIINMVHGGESNGRHIEGIGDFVEVEEVGTGFLMFKMNVAEKILQCFGREMAYVTDYEPRGEIHHMLFSCGPDPACPKELSKSNLLSAAMGDMTDLRAQEVLLRAASDYQKVWSDEQTGLGRYLTEDYRWCRLARMAGFKIYVYLDAAVSHIGVFHFEGAMKNYFVPVKCSRCNKKPAAGLAPYSDCCASCAEFMSKNDDS